MVERKICSFCGKEIEPGTGRMHIMKDGKIFQFCSSKCYKNLIELKRIPRRTEWTQQYFREKETRVQASHTAQKVSKEAGEEEPPSNEQ